MNQKLRQEIMILETYEIKPNLAELARKYGMDYRTVKKYLEGYEKIKMKKEYISKLDKYKEEIQEKIKLPGTTVMATYKYFEEKYGNVGKYSNFRTYIARHKMKEEKTKKAHPRFETPAGKQLQFDWKESLHIYTKSGERLDFNLMTSTLGFSRLHVFSYSRNRTREDVERCLTETFQYIGGIPAEVLTDNMSSIVNHQTRKFVPEFQAFCKDMGVNPKKCRIQRPQTKGKTESANRFVSWLVPYNGEIEDEKELKELIKKFNKEVNKTTNQATGVPPILLFEKEKEYLKPLPKKEIMSSYIIGNSTQVKVSEDFLVYYRGNRYSVDPKLIHQHVKLKEENNKLYIYYNNKIVTIHELSDKKINYNEEHYKSGLMQVMSHCDEKAIEEIIQSNLASFDYLEEMK